MTDVNGFNPYWLLAVNGFFTGLGVVTANWFYNSFIANRLEHVTKRFGGKKNGKNN